MLVEQAFMDTFLTAADATAARAAISAMNLPASFLNGDMIYASSGQAVRRSIGSDNQFLRVVSAVPTWVSLLAAHVAYSSAVAPLTATDVEAALDQIGGFFAAGIYASSTSPDTSALNPVNDGQLTWAHGLGVEPKLVVLKLKCLSNDASWESGDVIYIGGSYALYNGLTTGATIVSIDATNVYLHNRVGVHVVPEGGGSLETLDTTTPKWRWVITAYR